MMSTDIDKIPAELRELAVGVRGFERRPYQITASYCRRPVFGIRDGVEITFHEHCQREAERLQRHILAQLSRAGLLLAKAVDDGLLPDDIEFLRIGDASRLAQRQRSETANPGYLGQFAKWALVELFDLQQAGVVDAKFPRPLSRSREPISPFERLPKYQQWVAVSIEALADFIEQRTPFPDSKHKEPLPC